jgi:hypothetical protein
MEPIVDRFQNAWLSLNAESINVCISDWVKYDASPSGNSFKGRSDVTAHLAHMFNFLGENGVKSQVSKISPRKFLFTHTFESLSPITQYLIDCEGIYLIPCLEDCLTIMQVEISIAVKNNKIRKIQISQKNIVQCKSSAQHGLTFVSSIFNQNNCKILDYEN